ncbi:MAG: DUF4982 domain-containing protein [Clostridia bacterium]|nr:DUF4982 domain-containing protein [Clostridia bacterium]
MNRTVEPLKNDFKFHKLEWQSPLPEGIFSPEFNDAAWRTVRVPHDWGIEGEFDVENDPYMGSIIEDGQKKPRIHTGRTGGLPIVGAGVYRKWVEIAPADRVFLELDGVMWQSEVYCNGVKVGGYHFGYGSYEVELTEAVRFGEKNLIAIYAEVPPTAGRWYSGGGLYRNLRLIRKDNEHIKYNGIWVRRRYADRFRAMMDLSVETEGEVPFTAEVTAPNGTVTAYEPYCGTLLLEIKHPAFWDVDAPNLYTVTVTLPSGDSQTVRFGIRNCAFTKEGFFLNGRYLKMNGVCMHHDLGMLGAAVNTAALRRQIEIMKGMGVNAWRTSHNPPAPELLELCDEMGILVMDEFFDEWEIPKVDNGYAAHFAAHAVEDVTSIVRRDRNHPSVIMWSIGNEVREQNAPDGGRNHARLLYDATHAADPTRPITAGLNRFPYGYEPTDTLGNQVPYFCDVVGINYKPHLYEKLREEYPEMLLVGAETASCVSSRGTYHFPPKVIINSDDIRHEDLTVCSYEMHSSKWACYAEYELAAQRDCPYVMGEFIWTGFDYLGEPTPYYHQWPSRSSYFGVVDLAGLPKNRYYCYRSAWTDLPTLHIFPHWSWAGKEGETVPIHIYTNYDEVELFVNGISQGKRRHATVEECAPRPEDKQGGSHVKRFRLMWEDVIYQPGEITAIAYKNGKEMERKTVKTAGEPHHIELSAYKEGLTADGEDVNFITASIVDAEGNLCPHAANRLTFTVEGAALIGTDAGDQRETESILRPDKKALGGLLVCGIRALEKAGPVTVACGGEGLLPATLTLQTKK